MADFSKVLDELRKVKEEILSGVGNTTEWLERVFKSLQLVTTNWAMFLHAKTEKAEAPKKKKKEDNAPPTVLDEGQQSEVEMMRNEFYTMSSRTPAAVKMRRVEARVKHPVAEAMELAVCRAACGICEHILECSSPKE